MKKNGIDKYADYVKHYQLRAVEVICDYMASKSKKQCLIPVSYTHLDVYKRQECTEYNAKLSFLGYLNNLTKLFCASGNSANLCRDNGIANFNVRK